MFDVPVLIIVFNRPDITAKVFEAVAAMRPTKLFIAGDAPRPDNTDDYEKCEQVKSILANITWECEVHRLYQDQNLGCYKGPRTAIEWFFQHVERGIILEDDCLPSRDFFIFCSQLLEHYKDNHKIINICGSNMGDNREGDYSYFFSRFMNMSGWATWRRSVERIDYDLTKWRNGKRSLFDAYKILRQSIVDTDIHWYKYWKERFDSTIHKENITWWDWQWIYFQLVNKKLSIIPAKNLVTNIGFNEFATHTKDINSPLSNIPLKKLAFPLKHPKKIKPDMGYEEYAVKWVWCYHKRLPTIFYIKQFISNFIKK